MTPHQESPQGRPAAGVRATPSIPPARRIRHIGTLLWWGLASLVLVFALRGQPGQEPGAWQFSESQAPRTEHDAFIAFVFGKVSAEDPEAIDPQVLRAQLEGLKASGAQPVRLEDVRAFLEKQEPLPDKPVLLAFDEARRTTIDAVDPILTELGFPAVTFVTVDDIEGGNVDLVSRRRLGKMVRSGHWEVGVNACHGPAAASDQKNPLISAGTYRRWREMLQGWAGRPVLAASCLRAWRDRGDGQARWDAALKAASLPLGFVARAPGTNHRADPATALRMIRIPARDQRVDTLVHHASAYVPRRDGFADDFNGTTLASAWVVADREQVRAENGLLRLTARANDWGGAVTLGGTERWQDVKVAAELERPPTGQFWIFARRSGPASFVRLGISDGRVLLQKSGADGSTRQVAARQIGSGPVQLSLRVIGSRAVASVDGVPLLDRPTELPSDVAEGPVSLVTWNSREEAAANLRRVEIEPLPRRFAMLPAQPGEGEFATLRAQVEDLWAVSPPLFRWHAGSATRSASLDPALEMFVHYHRIALLPAVTIDKLPRGEGWDRFGKSMLRWAGQPGFTGLNVVVDHIQPEDIDNIEALRRMMSLRGRELVVTARRRSPDFPAQQKRGWLANHGPGPTGFHLASFKTRRHRE